MSDKNELKAFKNQIFKYGIIAAVICEVASLPFLGFNVKFTYGLVLGTCTAIVNYSILSFTATRIVNRGNGAWLAVLGYIIRLLIYGGVFYISYKVSAASGIAALLGFMTLKAGIYYVYGFKPKFSESSAKGKELNDLDNDEWSKSKSDKAKAKSSRILKFLSWPEEDE